MSPRGSSAVISSIASATCSAVLVSPRSGGGRQRTSTGYARPSTSTTGAPPKCSAKRAVSIVAEVTISLRSGRRTSRRLR